MPTETPQCEFVRKFDAHGVRITVYAIAHYNPIKLAWTMRCEAKNESVRLWSDETDLPVPLNQQDMDDALAKMVRRFSGEVQPVDVVDDEAWR